MSDLIIKQQVVVFVTILFVGFFAGFFFDLFRAVKNVFQLRSSVLFLTDLLFFLLITWIVFQVLLQLHWGEVRVYVFISFFCGITLHYLFFSPSLYRFFYRLLNKCLKTIIKILAKWEELRTKSRIIVNQKIIHWRDLIRKGKQHGG